MEKNTKQYNKITSILDEVSLSASNSDNHFVYNNKLTKNYVGDEVKTNLKSCLSFKLSVAFICDSGLASLLPYLRELEEKGVKGQIITTDYLFFSEPKALRKLLNFKNIEVRMFRLIDNHEVGLHTKGYLFENKDTYNILLGSSNITVTALYKNNEWNATYKDKKDSPYVLSVLKEYKRLWNLSIPLEKYIDQYEELYNGNKNKIITSVKEGVNKKYGIFTPRQMQIDFVNELIKTYKEGKNKALLISATGTGKTYASAYAAKRLGIKKLLFIVHREQVARKAMESFNFVLGNGEEEYGVLSGTQKDFKKNFLFGTMQTVSKDSVLKKFDPNEFEMIIIDEAHKSGAESYKKIMSYFTPRYWLGMTATPDRNDNEDVYSIFDHNIPYEIRLQQALDNDMVTQFNYFGISDIIIDGEESDEQDDLRKFNLLTSDKRVDYIIKEAKFYGYSGPRVKGLIFCSRIEEAKLLSTKFNERGFKTIYMDGSFKQEEREVAVKKLETNNIGSGYLDYIFVVDIFNEGVDIPKVNQVIFLRPTESSIIFVQQLGRGLRLDSEKEYVNILDFISNYKNNYLIPAALFGDKRGRKTEARKETSQMTLGDGTTIYFDALSREKILKAIDNADYSDVGEIKENYKNLKYKLGRIPELLDFSKYGEMDPCRIFNNTNLCSYENFLMKYEPEFKTIFTSDELLLFKFLSTKTGGGKRPNESVLLKLLVNSHGEDVKPKYLEIMNKNYEARIDDNHLANIFSVLNQTFLSGSGANTFSKIVLLKEVNNSWVITNFFKDLLSNDEVKKHVLSICDFWLDEYTRYYLSEDRNHFLKLGEQYSYEDVFRLLNVKKNPVALNAGGYINLKEIDATPIFVNYIKKETIEDSIKYEDKFVNRRILRWYSKNGRTLTSPDVKYINESGDKRDIYLFIRKNENDKIKEFYYLGKLKILPGTVPCECTMKNGKNVVEFYFLLDEMCDETIYNYLIN